MIRKALFLSLFTCFLQPIIASSQELYVYTEPASNMPAKSIALRLTNELMSGNSSMNRLMPEMMLGINKNIMFHLQGFFSNANQKFQAEGISLYGKYRFLSVDAEHRHFRAAVYGRISTSNRNMLTEDVNLEGDNQGWQGGLVFTQLLHKLALSATLGYAEAYPREVYSLHLSDPLNPGHFQDPDIFRSLNYSLSSGYLVLPFTYKNYNQPNLNLYLEVLGKTNPVSGRSYIDLAPAVQLILNSKTRIDLGYRFKAAGNMSSRYLSNMFLARVEFNFFNQF